jgi:RNA polymerase sigma-70 factor (ECF subfamily)
MARMASPEELAQFLARCALGDRHAFERLYRETSAQLFGLVLRIVRDRDLASEVLQEGYVKIWHRAGDFHADLARPLTWMAAIMRHHAIDLLRRSVRQPNASESAEELLGLADEAAGPQDIVAQAQQDQALHDCLGQLQGAQRQAVLLAYFKGLTHEELADHLNTPLGTVKSWLRRGLLRLKKCLDER